MNEPFIFHICTEQSWHDQSDSPIYIHSSLTEENFIHCSEDHQIQGVLQRYFQGQNDLLVLTIDVSKVQPKIQYDKAPNGEFFPHIYGPLNKDSIIKTEKIN